MWMCFQNFLKNLYYNVREPGSYTAPGSFYHAVKEKGKEPISRKQVFDWLNSQDTYTLLRPVLKKFKRNRIIVGRINDQWQADLIDIQKIHNHNGGNN